MLGSSVVALAAASARVLAAKADIHSSETLRSGMLELGQFESAAMLALQIGDLQINLTYYERVLVATAAEVHLSFSEAVAAEAFPN